MQQSVPPAQKGELDARAPTLSVDPCIFAKSLPERSRANPVHCTCQSPLAHLRDDGPGFPPSRGRFASAPERIGSDLSAQTTSRSSPVLREHDSSGVVGDENFRSGPCSRLFW